MATHRPAIIRTEAPDVVLVELVNATDDQAYLNGVQSSISHLQQFERSTVDKYQTEEDVRAAREHARATGRLRLGIWALRADELAISDRRIQAGARPGQFAGSINATFETTGTIIGYWRTAEQVRKGCMTLAARALSGTVASWGNEVRALTVPGNLDSAAVLTRAGFGYDGIIEDDTSSYWHFTYDPVFAAERSAAWQAKLAKSLAEQ